MKGILTFIFVMVAGFYVVRCFNRFLPGPSGQGGNASGTPAAKGTKLRGFTNYRPHKDIVSVSRDMSDRGSSVLRDDRNNDWLAGQLREEHKAFKATSEMFDLKIEHASHCDARLLEQFHRRNCDASGVDLANGSTLRG